MYHTIIIVGNLGRDPEMRYTPSGQAVTDLNVATNRQYTSSDGTQVKETTWFRVSVWGRMAEATSQYLRKGSRVLVEGRLNPDSATGGPRVWTGQDGASRASYEVTGVVVKFLSSRAENEALQQSSEYAEGAQAAEPEDDIPF